MTKIDQLIADLCPDGVEYKPLEQCCSILDNRRKPVTKSVRVKENFLTMVLMEYKITFQNTSLMEPLYLSVKMVVLLLLMVIP